MFSLFRRESRLSLEEQIQALAECGIVLRQGLTIDDLLASFNREQFVKDPFLLTLCVLGGTMEQPPYKPISEDIWHLDTECIWDGGDYVTIAERMRDLAKGNLPIRDIKDHVDIQKQSAWLSFSLDEKKIQWEAIVNEDWIDPSILTRFAELLAARESSRRFIYLDLGGQDCIIGCSSPEQLEAVKQKTGLPFRWLS